MARVPLSCWLTRPTGCASGTPSGWIGPAFDVPGLMIWGFTAGLTDALLGLGGCALPWDADRVVTSTLTRRPSPYASTPRTTDLADTDRRRTP